MRNTLYIIGLSAFVFSCTSQQNAKKKQYIPRTPVVQPKNGVAKTGEKPKPQVTSEHGVEFFTTNIADPTKNDNTASYGSIVSAKPNGYKVVKTYFPAIAQNFRQKYLILHYTALPDDKSITVLSQQTSVSSHYLVNNTGDNEIYQLVDENKRSYHAGISTWRADKNLNDTSIGIEIVNAGYTSDASGKKIFAPFDDAQVKKVAALVKDIITRYQIPATNILAHSDIAPTRKQDPGPLFPWKKLYDEYQIGMWYDEATKQNFYNTANVDFSTKYNDYAFIYNIQAQLQKFGYGLDMTGKWDDATKKTIEAFQYHFRPQNYDGIMDAETFSILQALIQKYPVK